MRAVIALCLGLALLANGWAATRLHASAHVPGPDTAVAAPADAALPPCHGDEGQDGDTSGAAATGCCSALCQHLCALMLTLPPPASAEPAPAALPTGLTVARATEAFDSQPVPGLWRPPRA